MKENDLTKKILKKAKKNKMSKSKILKDMLKDILNIQKKCIDKTEIVGKKLKEYQEKAVKFMLQNRGMIAAFQVGTGKTLTAVTVSGCILSMADYFDVDISVIIITPTSLVDNFKNEMKIYGDFDKDKFRFYTFSKFRGDYKKGLIDCSKTLLIVDKAHNLRTDYRNNFSGKGPSVEKKNTQAEFGIKCASKSWKILLLTATPIYNRTYDLVNLVSMVNGFNKPINEDLKDVNKDGLIKLIGGKILFQENDSIFFPERRDKILAIVMNEEYLSNYEDVEKAVSKTVGGKKKKTKKDSEEKKNSFMVLMRNAGNDLKPNIKYKYAVGLIEESVKKRKKVLF
jgi:superfamily II DNA or RNA helicase